IFADDRRRAGRRNGPARSEARPRRCPDRRGVAAGADRLAAPLHRAVRRGRRSRPEACCPDGRRYLMKWFRFYDEALDDPKVQRLSATMFRHWVNILCLANREPNRGYLPPLEDVAFGLRVNERKAQQVIDTLVEAGLLTKNPDSTVEPHGWKQRQRVSDNVAERVAKHRARNADVTLQETDSDNESSVTETF